MLNPPESFSCAAYIREVGRGARGGRGLSYEDANLVYDAILANRVSDLELGALLLAYRIKGETPQELAGMLDAVHGAIDYLNCPFATPVVIPSYNGARRRANLVPLLALLLSKQGIPVLIHGIASEPGRVSTAEILTELGIQPAPDTRSIEDALVRSRLAFASIDVLAPALAKQLALRTILGVRNSAHTLAKMLQPFSQPALRLVNYTHTAYRDTLADYFSQAGTAGPIGVLLSRGTEGEAVADTELAREALWLHGRGKEIAIPATEKEHRDTPVLPENHDASTTARWIEEVMAGNIPVPRAIGAQVNAIVRITTREASQQ
ncbi:DNA-binding protein YbiB [Pollutimonas subterranea]|uniref:DNA-binding protein YbiB n=1 Tax=Pollutimonas subterranea TaxID=2045210 RepID=A0A2N4U1W7_9BURK|nr:DNA-binding protein YbiB [Pollutimonas subterranea]PLC49008.1 DNA-binding protein YbiB [Pollutimonas subterranea]